jgi:energy-converting hydrogenase B subunit O
VLAESLLVLCAGIMASLIIPGVERKIQARIQLRYGPPLTTPGFFAVIKSLYKSDPGPDSPFPRFYKATALTGFAVTSLILLYTSPYYAGFGLASLLGVAGLMKVEEATYLFMGSMSRSVMSKTMAFPDLIRGSREKASRVFFEEVGSLRALKMLTLGSFPYYVSLTFPFIAAQSLLVRDVLAGPPAILSASGALAAAVYFIGYNIVTNNRPFDIIKPKVDIIEGPLMEYAGRWRGLTYLSRAFLVFTLSSVFITLYVGIPLNFYEAELAVAHLTLALAFPAASAVLKAYSPVLTFKQILPISYYLTMAGLAAIMLNIMGF